MGKQIILMALVFALGIALVFPMMFALAEVDPSNSSLNGTKLSTVIDEGVFLRPNEIQSPDEASSSNSLFNDSELSPALSKEIFMQHNGIPTLAEVPLSNSSFNDSEPSPALSEEIFMQHNDIPTLAEVPLSNSSFNDSELSPALSEEIFMQHNGIPPMDARYGLYSENQTIQARSISCGLGYGISNSINTASDLSVSESTGLEWQRCLGGSLYDYGYSIQQTTDGGYIAAGYTYSNDGDVSGSHGGSDAWIVKLDSNNAIQWQKCLGTGNYDGAISISQTADGGYIFSGSSYYSYSYTQAWVAKTSSRGELEWQKYYLNQASNAYSIQQTTDGGYILAGDTQLPSTYGYINFSIIKLSPNGAPEWIKSLGGSNHDYGRSIQQTSDGGYIAAGYTYSNDGDVSGNHGSTDYWVVKLASDGIIQWQKCLGGSSSDQANSIKQTADGGYIVAGSSSSNDGDVSLNQGSNDFWVVKLNSEGAPQWQRCLGGSSYDVANEIQLTADGGYVVIGSAHSSDGEASYNHGSSDYLVVKLASNGASQWQKCLGGSNEDYGQSIQQTADGGYITAGYTYSNNGDVSGNHGASDYWVAKIKPQTTPTTPLQPLGPVIGLPGISYSYDTSATDPNGYNVKYVFDWGDSQSETDYIGSGITATATHSWSSTGSYQVRAMAVNSAGISSEWSDWLNVTINASIPPTSRCLGGSLYDYGYSIQQTTDGGYIAAGYTYSNDGDVSGSHGGSDAWIVKLDSNNAIQWQKCLGTGNYDGAISISQTADGGYIFSGSSYYSYSYTQAWVAKTSSRGELEWQKYYLNQASNAYSIQQTTDGGYILAGDTQLPSTYGYINFSIIKLSPNGAPEWIKSLGGSNHDYGRSIQQTSDGGYIAAGYTYSNDGDVSGNHGSTDYWVVKLASDGIIQWQKCLGGSSSDQANSIKQTADGGYIVAGSSSSNDGDVSLNQGSNDFWVVKLNSEGAPQWQRCLGGSSYDVANEIQLTADGGYVVIGSAHSSDGEASYNHGSSDYLVVKLASNGASQWQKCLAGVTKTTGKASSRLPMVAISRQAIHIPITAMSAETMGLVIIGWRRSNPKPPQPRHCSH